MEDKVIIIEKYKNFSHIVGAEFKEVYRLNKVTKRFIMDLIGNALDDYFSDNQQEYDEQEELLNLESGTYYINASDFSYMIKIVFNKLTKRIDEYDEFYDFQLQAFEAVYDFFSDESMIGIDETHSYKIDNNISVIDYVVANQKESTVGFLRIIKGNDFYSYEIN